MRITVYIILTTAVVFSCIERAWCQFPLTNGKAVVRDMKLWEDKGLLIASVDGSIEVWNYVEKTFVKRWPAPKITAISVHNGKVAGVSADGHMYVWDVSDGSQSLDKALVDDPLIAVAWIDDDHLAVGGENRSVLKVSALSGAVVSQAAIGSTVTALVLINPETLVAGNANGVVSAYNAESMTLKKSIKDHRQWTRQIVASDTLHTFYTASDDGHVCNWETNNLSTSSCRKFGNWILALDVVDYHNESSRITAVGKRSGELIIDASVGRYSAQLDAMITSLEIIDARLPDIVVAVGTYGGGIQLWEAKEMKFRD